MKGSFIFYPARPSARFCLLKYLTRHIPILALLVLGLASERISLGAEATLSSTARPVQTTAYLLSDTSITGDFDNDNQPDLAIIRSEGSKYKIEIHLSTRSKSVSYIVPSSTRSITIIVCDVDDDEDKDDDLLILDSTSLRPLGVWINNNGDGRFEKFDDPSNASSSWSDGRSGYIHNSDRRNQAVISQNNRLPFGLFTLGFSLTKLEPKGPISGGSRKGSLQILPDALHGRSPPLYSLVRT